MTIATITILPPTEIKRSKRIKNLHYGRLIDSDILYKAKKEPSKLTSKEKKTLKAFLGGGELEAFLGEDE